MPRYRKAYRVRPYSRREPLGAIDLRTREGQFIARIEADLSAQLGNNLSAGQQILIKMAAIKICKVATLATKIANGTTTPHDDLTALAWMNGARRDLEALGLNAAQAEVTESLDHYIERQYGAHRSDGVGRDMIESEVENESDGVAP